MRPAIALAISLLGGIAAGWIDSRPGFDDTGVTALALVLCAGLAALIARRAPWLWAISTGIWVPLLEWSEVARGGPLLALAFSGLGAVAGWAIARRPAGGAPLR